MSPPVRQIDGLSNPVLLGWLFVDGRVELAPANYPILSDDAVFQFVERVDSYRRS